MLVQWPVHRWKCGTAPGVDWGTVGGSIPAFFWGHSARDGNWPGGEPALVGEKLIKAVRKYLAIKPPGKLKLPAIPAVTASLRTELSHALGDPDGPDWYALKTNGATDRDILNTLSRIWPKKGDYVPPEESGGDTGYTTRGFAEPTFWVGKPGYGDRVSYMRETLAEVVRATLRIPTQEEAQRDALAALPAAPDPLAAQQARGTRPMSESEMAAVDTEIRGQLDRVARLTEQSESELHEIRSERSRRAAATRRAQKAEAAAAAAAEQSEFPPDRAATDLGMVRIAKPVPMVRAMPRPGNTWTNDALIAAGKLCGCDPNELVICNRCDRARSRQTHPCPCGSPEFHLPGASGPSQRKPKPKKRQPAAEVAP